MLLTHGLKAVIRFIYDANGEMLQHTHEFTDNPPVASKARVLWSLWFTYGLKAVVRYIYNAYCEKLRQAPECTEAPPAESP